jgi:hypothetical protein
VVFLTACPQPQAAADTVTKIMRFHLRFISEFRVFYPN